MTKNNSLPTIEDIATGESHLISCEHCHKFQFFYVAGREFPTYCLECAEEAKRGKGAN